MDFLFYSSFYSLVNKENNFLLKMGSEKKTGFEKKKLYSKFFLQIFKFI